MQAPVIFDGRNLFAPEEMAAAGFVYHSVGRTSPALKRPVAMQLGIPNAVSYTVARIAAAAEQANLETRSLLPQVASQRKSVMDTPPEPPAGN